MQKGEMKNKKKKEMKKIIWLKNERLVDLVIIIVIRI